MMAEVFMPGLDKSCALLAHLVFDFAQLAGGKPDIAGDSHFFQPELYSISAFVDMDMRRLMPSLLKK